jgi:branched-chain amino acid transport system substrate-binding protein
VLVFRANITSSFVDDIIRIGVLTNLTGYGADLGAAAKDGINLAVEEINANGGLLGRKIEAIFRDDASNRQTESWRSSPRTCNRLGRKRHVFIK